MKRTPVTSSMPWAWRAWLGELSRVWCAFHSFLVLVGWCLSSGVAGLGADLFQVFRLYFIYFGLLGGFQLSGRSRVLPPLP